jgi:hypothetical protein
MVPTASNEPEEGRNEPICIRLSRAQVNHVVRAAGPTSGILALLRDLGAKRQIPIADPTQEPIMNDRRLSRSVLTGLLVLAYFTSAKERKVGEIAAKLHMSPSTAHRFIKTLQAAGLVEQNPDTQAYRLVRR